MKVTHRFKGPVALISLLGGLLGLLALLSLLPGDSAEASSSAPLPEDVRGSLVGERGVTGQSLAAFEPALPLISGLATVDSIVCTLDITTTDKAPIDNTTIEMAASIANYTEQSLLEGAGPYPVGAEVATRSDFYRLDNATIGYRYTIQAKADRTNNYDLGMIVYNLDRVPIITDTNTFDGTFARAELVAENHGPYYFEVFQISEQCRGGTYSLILGSVPPPTATFTPQPGPTATPSPDATWMSGFDQYEPNFSFDLATTIAPGINYRMNFVPWGGADVDNDFLKVRVKPGLQLTCETSDLDPGVDPRMAFYSGPGEQHYLMSNDDIALGNFNSRLSYYATYEGWLYILIGQGTRMARRDTVNSAYTVTCQLTAPGQATPLPGQPTPGSKDPVLTQPPPVTTATPRPPTSPVATPTPEPETEARDVSLTFRLITRPEPPTPTPEPEGFRTFRVLVYFDADLDAQMGAGEGVAGFFVLVLSADGSRELAQGYTDEQGQLSFTVPTVSTVRVLVPLLGYDRLIEASRPEVKVRIVPPTLPEAIP